MVVVAGSRRSLAVTGPGRDDRCRRVDDGPAARLSDGTAHGTRMRLAPHGVKSSDAKRSFAETAAVD